MSVSDLLLGHAILGLPLGLLSGLVLGPVARRKDGWGGYGALARRAARLGHVAAVALPLVSGFYGLLVRTHPGAQGLPAWVAWLWVGSAALLATALWVGAARVRLLPWLVTPPALGLLAGGVAFAGVLAPALGPGGAGGGAA